MKAFAQHTKIAKALTEAGVLPPHCLAFELSLHVDRVIRIKTEVFATEDQVLAIAAALKANPEEAREIATEVLFKARNSEASAKVEF